VKLTGGDFNFSDQNGKDVTGELEHFANLFRLERLMPGRYSKLLLLQLFGGFKSGMLDPSRVINEIESLEGGPKSQLKPAARFRKPPLKGLWHKHYLPDGLFAMAQNLQNALSTYGIPWFQEQVRLAEESGEQRYLHATDVAAIRSITDDAVSGNWARRSAAGRLTGEWIVFAKKDNVNFYLCLGSHKDDQQKLRTNIDSICWAEFPLIHPDRE
jgi:hypothetical protein